MEISCSMCQNEPSVYRMTFWQCRPTSSQLFGKWWEMTHRRCRSYLTLHISQKHILDLETWQPQHLGSPGPGTKGHRCPWGETCPSSFFQALPSLPSVLLSFYSEVKVQRMCARVRVRENLCHSPLAVVSWQTGSGLQLCLPRSLWCLQVQSRPDHLCGASRPCCKYEMHFILVCHAPDEDRCMFSPSCG